MDCNIVDLFSKRHSFYDINNKIQVDDNTIVNIIKKCLELYPSSFNTQSARVLLLLNGEHQRFWSLTENILLESSPQDKADAIKKRILSFAKGYGTILFFDDTDIVNDLKKKMPLYATSFKNWSHQSNAILQFMIWCALADINIGASMQHYNPLIDKVVKDNFNIPQNLELIAQMPFGGIENSPTAHSVENIENKFQIKT